ncbi:MAG: hypothetical protein BGO43_02740 [Gammaproteobacteria bacterium 39-13]|nr:sulfite exporter TauE/SafE family protein [Gammaproteobacteria bacterium]OJV85623.1 MAG: hypothetical protein BGO43_02740 [Gammaproteobacteria bacterium 39-13]
MIVFLAYVIVGIFTGILSGLLGLGGGVIIVPALTVLFAWQEFPSEYIMHLAIGTSLATMIITTIMVTWSYHRRSAVQWSLLKFFLPGIVIGSLCGVSIGKHLSTQDLRYAFALFTIILGVRIIWHANAPHITKPITVPAPILFLFALLVGVLAGILGIGGGIVLIPLFLWLGLSLTHASATSAACAFSTAFSGALTSILVGWKASGLPAMTLGFVYWPVALLLGIASLIGAPVGVYLAHRLPVPVIKRIFGGILLIIAWRMLPLLR